jgi:hypothetical protein
MTFFNGGEPAMRALIAKTLGMRYVLTNKSLAIEMSPAFTPLCEMKNATKISSGSLNSGVSSPMHQVWWGTLDGIRTAILQVGATVPGMKEFGRILSNPSVEHRSHQ